MFIYGTHLTPINQFHATHPVVYTELHKYYYVFRLTQPLFIIIFQTLHVSMNPISQKFTFLP
jgi:hypothetical protein